MIRPRTIPGKGDMKQRRWTLAAIALVALAAALPVTAGPLEDGLTAYREHNYAAALALWQPLADKGNPAAQYQIGTLYAEGKGVAQNDATAAQWFQRAADQGDAASQYNLAVSYAEGLGVAKDDALAAKWFRRAADQGMPYAQLNLGFFYATKRVTPPDDVEAVKWLEARDIRATRRRRAVGRRTHAEGSRGQIDRRAAAGGTGARKSMEGEARDQVARAPRDPRSQGRMYAHPCCCFWTSSTTPAPT